MSGSDLLLMAVCFGAALYFGQVIWVAHQRQRENNYQRLFLTYVNSFLQLAQDADSEEARERMGECIRMEQACLVAQEAIKREMFIWPWRWPTRWAADYLSETLDRA